MAYFHVDLASAGTSGDGSTWETDSSPDAAFSNSAGFASAVNAAAAGDTIFVKNSDTTSSTAVNLGSSFATLAYARNPVKIIGVQTGVTNLGVNIDNNDVIAGIRTGGGTPAYADAGVPVLQINSASSNMALQAGLWIYGMRLVSGNDMNIVTSLANGTVYLEEVSCEVTGTSDIIKIADLTGSFLWTKNARLQCGSNNASIWLGEGRSLHINTVVSMPSGGPGIFGTGASTLNGSHQFIGCDLATGGATTIINKKTTMSGHASFENCSYASGFSLTGGTAVGGYRFESYGSDSTSGLATADTEQQLNIETHAGTITTETTAVRTGGADDGATGGTGGAFSWDMTTFANGTALYTAGLESPWMAVWIDGDGTAKTVTVYIASDSGNTEAGDWDDEELWLEAVYPDDGGTSKHDFTQTVNVLLSAASAVTDDTSSSWGGTTQNPQQLQASISPDYSGWVRCRVVFAPGANAETIYVDPRPVIS